MIVTVLGGTVTHKRMSAISSLKELVVILSGITITVAITTVAETMRTQTVGSPWMFALFTVLILNVVRFYHGNMRLLDDSYLDADRVVRRNIVVDFVVIFTTSVLFAAMGAFLNRADLFYTCFLSILVIDIIWALLALASNNQDELQIQQRWLLNNLVFTVFVVLATLGSFQYPGVMTPDVTAGIVLVCLMLNTLIDFFVSRNFYFPSAA